MKKLRKKQIQGNYSDFEFQEFVEDLKQYKNLAISLGFNEEIKLNQNKTNRKSSNKNTFIENNSSNNDCEKIKEEALQIKQEN